VNQVCLGLPGVPAGWRGGGARQCGRNLNGSDSGGVWIPAKVVYSRAGVRDAWTSVLLAGGIGLGLISVASFAPFSGAILSGVGFLLLGGGLFLGWRHGTSRVEVGLEGFVVYSRWGRRAFRWADVSGVFAIVLQDLSGRDSYAADLAGSEWGTDDAVLGVLVRFRESGRVVPLEVHEGDAVEAVREYWQRYLSRFSDPMFLP